MHAAAELNEEFADQARRATTADAAIVLDVLERLLDADPPHRQAELFGNDASKHGQHARALFDDRRLNGDLPITSDVQNAAVDAGRGRKFDQGQTSADACWTRLVQADGVRRRFEHFAHPRRDVRAVVFGRPPMV